MTAWFIVRSERRERPALAALGVLATLVPLLLELVGLVPRSFGFEGGNLVLYPRAFHFPPLGTTLALVYTNVSFCIVGAVLLGGLRDALTAAERKLFLHAWHLQKLATEAGRKS
jgi:serine/threonine-protein kinase